MFAPLLAQSTQGIPLLDGMPPDKIFVLLIVAIGCTTAVVISSIGILSGVFYNVHRRRREDDLKRDMLDRGMTADDIETVVKATPPTDFIERAVDRKRSKHS